MIERSWPVTIVDACLRDGTGGSPTAVLADDSGLDDRARRRVASVMRTSHAVFINARDHMPVRVRFFTAAGELPACGHGTVAALAFLAEGDRELRVELRTATRLFTGSAIRDHDGIGASFDAGVAAIRKPTGVERELVLDAFGSASEIDTTGVIVASLGRERLLVPVGSRSKLAGLTPNFERLRDGCDRLGLLGCYAYSAPSPTGRLAARMFAPSIGVREDIANANGAACLAAMLAREGMSEITVDMGDSLGSPATITACAKPHGLGVRGLARIAATQRVSLSELYQVG